MAMDLRRFFQSDGAEETVRQGLDFSGVELGGVKPFCAPVEVKARLKGFAGSVELELGVRFTLRMPCDRCAVEVAREYQKHFFHVLVRELENGEDADELIPVPEEKLDLEGLVLEDVLLDMPGQFLCKEDCKGLCPQCGKNWNEGPCGCYKPETDPRLEVLRQLL
ncbi:DUF177 domain-containing protein [Oscillospiraceae bacterium 42-9]